MAGESAPVPAWASALYRHSIDEYPTPGEAPRGYSLHPFYPARTSQHQLSV
jgi:hypothetical protein